MQQFLFWSLPDLYKYFLLTCYKQSPSAWVSRYLKAWDAVTSVYFAGSQVVQGTTVTGRNQQKLALGFEARCLPQPAINTIGLLSLLWYW